MAKATQDDYGSFGRSCWKKERFRSKRKAEEAAERYQLRFHEYMNVYKCRYCGYWHMGHPPISYDDIKPVEVPRKP